MYSIKTHGSLNLTLCKILWLPKHRNFKFNVKQKQPKGCLNGEKNIPFDTQLAAWNWKQVVTQQLTITAQGL